MKNSKIVIISFLILTLLAVVAYMVSQKNIASENMGKSDEMITGKDLMDGKQDNAMDKKEDSVMKNDSGNMETTMENSQYIEYSSTALTNNVNKRRVLFFYANWCPTCRPADVNFQTNAIKIPKDAVLIRVNYKDSETSQQEKDLANLYGITYQHTFVQIDEKGKEIIKWNGGQIDELLANIK